MLRNKIILSLVVMLATFATQCKPNSRSYVADDSGGGTEETIRAQFDKAIKSPSVFNMYYSPIWLLEERALVNLKGDERGFRGCALQKGLENQTPSSQPETLFIPKECGLDPLKTQDLSFVFMNVKNWSVNPLPADGRVGKAFRIPFTSMKGTPCKASDASWQKVGNLDQVPGMDIYDAETRKEFDQLNFSAIYVNRGTAVVMGVSDKGFHVWPNPKICDLGNTLDEPKPDALPWARTWREVVRSENSYYNDSYWYDFRLTKEPNDYWYRNFMKHFLDSESEGNALVFGKGETATAAAQRIQDQMSQYVQQSAIAKISMIPTIHLDESGQVSCFSMQFASERSNGTELRFRRFKEWEQTPEKDAFKGLASYTFTETTSRELSSKIFQLRYVLGRYKLADRADEAAMLLPVNGAELGYPLCYRADGSCLIQVGENLPSQKTCESLIQESWSH